MKTHSCLFKSVTALLIASLLPSCAEMGPVLNNTGLSALAGGALGAGAGALIDKKNRGRGALIGGILGSLVGVAIAKSYQASARQKAYAEARARRSLSSSSVRRKMKEKGASRVAVAVPRSDGQSKGVVFVDENGKPDSKVMVPEKPMEAGNVYNLGGRKAYLANSWQGI